MQVKRKALHDTVSDGSDEDQVNAKPVGKVKKQAEEDMQGLYLDTINRNVLDFDFERVCSVSLSNLNVYACLVCGKYFQGRGKTSHAYFHSLTVDHHVFINLQTLKFYILPEDKQVIDSTLDDIVHVVHPNFTSQEIQLLDSNQKYSYDLNNIKYLPGFIGLNNIKDNDYMNVVLQCLTHVKPIRDYFLSLREPVSNELVNRTALLMKKIWNPRAFKGQVSPHEVLQQISSDSRKKFSLTKQGDPIEVLSWLLNALHSGLGGSRKKSSIIHDVFQGELIMQTQKIAAKNKDDIVDEDYKAFDISEEIKSVSIPFLFLAFELPATPLFQDEAEKNIIPQIPITKLLEKYDGVTVQEIGNEIKRYKITKLPKYLIFHIKRFNRNNFTVEKNHTIVNFPTHDLDMRPYLVDPSSTNNTKYNLISNISHQGQEKGEYKIHVNCKGKKQWFELEDLYVAEDVLPHMIFLSESYIQVWELQE